MNSYAILIGINEYEDSQNLSSLRYAEKDCRDLYQVLTDSKIGNFSVDDTKVLSGSEATLRNIEEALYTFIVKDRTPDDTVLVYFSGHGFLGGDQHLPYLGTHDVRVKELLRNPNLGLRMDRLHDEIFMKSPAKQVLFILDCCHSGALTPSSARSLTDTMSRGLIDRGFFSSGTGRVALFACPPDAVSRESSDLQNGIFTHYILRALKGEAADLETGEVTLDNLMAYVRDHASPEQPSGMYGQSFGRIVLSHPGVKRTQRAHKLIVDISFTDPVEPKLLSNPLDQYMGFIDQLLQQLENDDLPAGAYVENRILNAVRRASGAEFVFLVRFDQSDLSWSIKDQSEVGPERRDEADFVKKAISRIMSVIPSQLGSKRLKHDVFYPYEDKTSKTFLAVPLLSTHISEFMIVYGLPADSYLLGDVFSHILGTLYSATREMTSVDPLVIETSILDGIRRTYGYVPSSVYQRRFELLRKSLANTDIYFEPILHLEPNSLYICGWEALARDKITEVAPVNLFAAAELWGREFTIELDMFFIRRAMERYREALREAKMRRPNEVQDLSVNVYPASLMSRAYFKAVDEALKEYRLLPHKVILEISEKAPMPEDINNVNAFKSRLEEYVKKLRIGFAIDDFGVGYASVSRLIRLNPNYVKIDREVLHHEFSDATIRFVLDVVAQGRLLAQRVIIEGFDTDSKVTLSHLYELGVRFIQGYSIGKAGPKLYRLEKELYQYLEQLITRTHSIMDS